MLFFDARIIYPIARQLPNAALPYTPGVGPAEFPPAASGISALNSHGPSVTRQVSPFSILVFEIPVPNPSEGFNDSALWLRSNASLIFSDSFITARVKEEILKGTRNK